MQQIDNNFRLVLPAELEKSSDGEWKIRGLATTESKDQQGEVIIQKGVDLTPIDQKKGYFNFDHQPGVENLIGVIDGYQKDDRGIYVEGRLFKNHTKAKAVYEIMSSLSKGDHGRVGLSVEGKIIERDSKNPKIIKKCQINKVAVTLNPVNTDTYADLVKSLTASEVAFEATEENVAATGEQNPEPMFTSAQVMQLIQKALACGDGGVKPPTERSGGEALAVEELDKKPKSIAEEGQKTSSKFKKLSKDIYKAHLTEILAKLQILYPAASREALWATVKERLQKKFPQLAENDD